jgi:hypothetical protein
LSEKKALPSPLSLAYRTMNTYLIIGSRIRLYILKDKTSKMSSSCLIPLVKVLAYNVPISPYTTPINWNASLSVLTQSSYIANRKKNIYINN